MQPLAGFKIAFVRNGFDPAPGDGRGGGAPAARCATGGCRWTRRGGRCWCRGWPRAARRAAAVAACPSTNGARSTRTSSTSTASSAPTSTPVDLPDLSIAGTIGFILETESAASFDDLTRSGDADLLRTGTSASSWANTFKSARFVPAVEYLRAQRARVLLMRQMDEFMSKYDALLSAGSDSTLGVTNLTGHPAIALKCSIYNNDTPVMLMVTGKLYDEADDLPRRARVRAGDGLERSASHARLNFWRASEVPVSRALRYGENCA